MKTLRAWTSRLRGMFRQQRWDTEIAAELDSHLEMHMADNLRAGMTPDEARREARLKLGGVEAAREAYRDRTTAPFLEHLALDLRFTLRQLQRSSGFAITSILVLALGMCASIAIFSFVDATLIKPLPYPDPARLASVTESSPEFPRGNLSYPDYLDWKRENTVFASLDAYTTNGFLLTTPSGVEPERAARVSAGFFRTLGVHPLMGRDFVAGEEAAGGPHVVILTHQSWTSRFGAGADIVGKPVILSGVPYTVIGVLPPDFRFAPVGKVGFWTTIDPSNSCTARRSCHGLYGVGRLKEGMSLESAQANMAIIAKRLETQYPDSNRGQGASVISLADSIVGTVRPVLLVLMGGAALLLLIACVNVASLLLVRSEGRRREMAVRSALGASLGRLLSQFVTEGLVLVLVSTALGLLFANWATQALMSLIPAPMVPAMPALPDGGFNLRVVAYAALLALGAVLLFSITPALHLWLSEMRDGLAEGSRGSAGKAWRRLGSRLVVVELATAMMLLVAAGLFGKSLYRLLSVDLGLRPDHLATLTLGAPDVRYGKDEQSIALAQDVIANFQSLPGVQSVALTTTLPVSYNGNTTWIRFPGRPYDGTHMEVNERDVSAKFFETIGAKLLRGRYFTDGEDKSKLAVTLINETLAKKYFPNEDPIGKQMGDTDLSPKSLRTIVGVVQDVRDGALDSDIWPAVYHPFNQDPGTYFVVMVRTAQPPEAVLPELRSALRRIHPDVGVVAEGTMDSLISNSFTAYLHRSAAWLVGGFAILALILGVIGLYGVIAYSVSQRTREIGVRMALGAGHRSVYKMILKEAGWLTGLGIGLGAIGAVALATLARKLLFGVSSWDIQTLLAVAAVLGVASIFASFVPARRATLVNPVEALRTE